MGVIRGRYYQSFSAFEHEKRHLHLHGGYGTLESWREPAAGDLAPSLKQTWRRASK